MGLPYYRPRLENRCHTFNPAGDTKVRDAALAILGGNLSILDIARKVTTVLDDAKVDRAAIIGGVAVVLPATILPIYGIRTVALRDLLNIKLHRGKGEIAFSQDTADALGLIRHHELDEGFAKFIDGPPRRRFRQAVRAVQEDRIKMAAELLERPDFGVVTPPVASPPSAAGDTRAGVP